MLSADATWIRPATFMPATDDVNTRKSSAHGGPSGSPAARCWTERRQVVPCCGAMSGPGKGRAYARVALAGNPSDGYGGRTLAVTVPGLAAGRTPVRGGDRPA